MNPNTLSDPDTRRYDIDWLRVFATYLLLLFHAGMVFNPAPFYHIRNSDVSFAFLILCGFISLWHMPLFFLLAGWSACASLSMRGTGEFLKERFFRLFIVSSTLTLTVYHFLVRPFAVPRFLCGMKARVYALRPRLAPGLTAAGVMLVMVALGTATSSEASRQIAASPIGRWYAEGGAAQVDISDCGSELCGRVVWLRSPVDENGCELRDRYNPDQSLRHRPVIGLDILRGLAPASGADALWKGGTIYDPGSGKTYRASLSVVGENRIDLRGYVGLPLIGRTTSWFRVGSEPETCREAS